MKSPCTHCFIDYDYWGEACCQRELYHDHCCDQCSAMILEEFWHSCKSARGFLRKYPDWYDSYTGDKITLRRLSHFLNEHKDSPICQCKKDYGVKQEFTMYGTVKDICNHCGKVLFVRQL